MKISNKALKELRLVLEKSYGKELNDSLSDEEVNEIGELLLTILAESLKMKMHEKEKSTR